MHRGALSLELSYSVARTRFANYERATRFRISDPQADTASHRNIESYEHHQGVVSVRSDLKRKHHDDCLCYHCERFKRGTQDNCMIAQAVYRNCGKFNIVTPVWECPIFKKREG
jgi:hypothetical protein